MAKDFKIINLNKENEVQYIEFLKNDKNSLIYYSPKYRTLLTALLGDVSEYLLAEDNNRNIIGSLPIFYHNKKTGIVANSLPFYGSHGGVISDYESVRENLLEVYLNNVNEKKCVASTIIGSPWGDYDDLYKNKLEPDFIDERISLITYFPYNELNIEEALMEAYYYKTRNSIRKAQKNGIRVINDNSEESLEFLTETHKDNMIALGGIPKERKFFDLLVKVFEPVVDYDIYVAYKDNERIAALLLLYFNNTVEYFSPATINEFRKLQPMSLIIYEAMQDAMKRNMKRWNWGGTWLSQESLYRFKSRWGSTETRYFYYTNVWDKNILNYSKKDILNLYRNYFVYPFDQVK